jgi:hypothetical protein
MMPDFDMSDPSNPFANVPYYEPLATRLLIDPYAHMLAMAAETGYIDAKGGHLNPADGATAIPLNFQNAPDDPDDAYQSHWVGRVKSQTFDHTIAHVFVGILNTSLQPLVLDDVYCEPDLHPNEARLTHYPEIVGFNGAKTVRNVLPGALTYPAKSTHTDKSARYAGYGFYRFAWGGALRFRLGDSTKEYVGIAFLDRGDGTYISSVSCSLTDDLPTFWKNTVSANNVKQYDINSTSGNTIWGTFNDDKTPPTAFTGKVRTLSVWIRHYSIGL